MKQSPNLIRFGLAAEKMIELSFKFFSLLKSQEHRLVNKEGSHYHLFRYPFSEISK